MKSLEERYFSLPIALYKAWYAMSKQGKLAILKEKKDKKELIQWFCVILIIYFHNEFYWWRNYAHEDCDHHQIIVSKEYHATGECVLCVFGAGDRE